MPARREGAWTIVALAAATAVAGSACVRGCDRAPSPPAGAAPKHAGGGGGSGVTIPALAAAEHELLRMPIQVVATTDPPGRRIHMRLGRLGDAFLTLHDPPPDAADVHGAAFSDGFLEAPDWLHGHNFLEAVAFWLRKKPPPVPARKGRVRPFRINYVRLGQDAEWQANKLFLQTASLDAEVFLNVRLDGKEARLLEKDPEYREPLLALLAIALRDGVPPRRTPDTDPLLASAAPLVPALRPVAGGDGADDPALWLGNRWVATREGTPARIQIWDDLGKPPRTLVELPGRASGLTASPRGDRLAVTLVHPQDRTGMSSADPAEVVVVTVAGGKTLPLTARTGDLRVSLLSNVVWSPRGDLVAIGADAGAGQPPSSLTCVYEAASGRAVARTRPELNARPSSWNDEDLVLEAWPLPAKGDAARGAPPGRQAWRWRPGKGDPPRVAGDARAAVELTSPDGRTTVTVVGTRALHIKPRTGEPLLFAASEPGDRAALESLKESPGAASWLGSGALVLEADASMALDLATARLRYVLPDDDARFSSASPDGKRVVAKRAGDGRLLWGKVETEAAPKAGR